MDERYSTGHITSQPCTGLICPPWRLCGGQVSISPWAKEKQRPLHFIGLIFVGYVALAMAVQYFFRLKHGEVHRFIPEDAPGYLGNSLLFLAIDGVFSAIIQHRFHLTYRLRRVFHFLGDISYPLYVVHFAVYIIVSRYMQNPWLLRMITLVFATIVYYGCDIYSRRKVD